ncbi:MAG: GAF domain-containing protein, partial [Proteobacteria bacterium]|nr:GAF domain-containing protein [Pseudomonadota bacterium]
SLLFKKDARYKDLSSQDLEKDLTKDNLKRKLSSAGGSSWLKVKINKQTFYEFWAPVAASKNLEKSEDIMLYFDSPVSDTEEMTTDDAREDTTSLTAMGLVRIGLSLEGIEASIRKTLITSLSIATIFLPFVIIMAFIIARRVTTPVLRLRKAVDAIEKDGTYEKIPVHTKDEVGHLAISYNRMVDSLLIKDVEIQDHVEQLYAGNTIASAINQSMGLESTLHVALKEVIKVTGMKFGWIYLPSDNADYLEMIVHEGINEVFSNKIRRLKIGDGIAGNVVSNGVPIILEDLTEVPDLIIKESLLEESFRAFASIPLRSKEVILGVMNITSHSAHTFSKYEIELLNSIGDQIGSAVEKSRLYDQLKEHLVEIQNTQEQLIKTARLATLGEMATSVAHEVNNPLTGVLTHTCMLLDKLSDDQVNEKRKLTIIREETLRIRGIVRKLLDFSRQSDFEMEASNVLDVIRDVLDLVTHQVKMANISINEIHDEDLPRVYIDKAQIKQVILNLITNAMYAMPEGGELKIRVFASEGWLKIGVQDSGVGMEPETVDKVFDPFFTTKPEEQGTGLGLSISNGIIKKHGGSIDLKSLIGKGSTFTVKLPLKGEYI